MAPSTGVQTGAGNLLESFVTVGTPLPSLDKADKGEFKPVWEQEVTDEQGRKRFHGAFTGGFTAGYYGTVGSKEGWAPSTFKSSRSNRAADKSKGTAQLAEDLMDEEDLAELAASRTLSTAAAYAPPSSSTYDPLLGVFGPQAGSSSTVPATAALASLIEPASTRIGAQLMRKMGWRDGQGVGPRITFDQRKKQALELGVKLDGEDEEDGGEASKHYFAPLDRPLATVLEVGIATDRGWGLGYKAGPSIPSSSGSAQTTKGAARATFLDDDEDDVYGGGPMAPSKGSDGWGVVDVDMDDGITLLDHSRSKQRPSKPPLRKPARARESFHDGTKLLAGFTLGPNVISGHAISPLPPKPPPGWAPNPQRLWDEASFSSLNKGKGKQLNATERGTLLGEAPPPPVPKSVFDYLSARDKARIASLTHPPGSSSPSVAEPSATPAEPDGPLHIPTLDAATALAALKGFQPFSPSSTSPDAARQARYTLFLQLQAHLLPPSNATLPFGPRKLPTGLTQTINELNRELDDYARAARVFKPVTGMLAGRFASGGAGGTAPKVEPGLYRPPPKAAIAFASAGGDEAAKAEEEEHLTPAQTAARAGMFGPLTRTVDAFRPMKLLCKRFGVVDPWEGDDGTGDEVGGAWKEASRTGYGRPAGGKGVGEVLGKRDMDALMQSAGFRKFQPDPVPEEVEVQVPMTSGEGAKGKGKATEVEGLTLASVGLGDDEKQGDEILTYTKAPKDIFAAIFADSDDEDEDDKDEDELEEDTGDAKIKMIASAPSTTDVVPGPPPPVAGNDQAHAEAEADADAEAEADIVLTTSTLASYRPSFNGTKPSAAKPDEKKPKKKKPKVGAKVALSFDVDEDGETPGATRPKVSKKRRRDEDSGGKAKEKAGSKEVIEMEWVEVPALPNPATPAPAPAVGGKGRAKASDLY